MAFGIDDVLMTAAAGISLTDTVVRTIEAYRTKGIPLDIELLIEEVRITALQRIDEADEAYGKASRNGKRRPLEHRQLFVAEIGHQHQSRRVRDREG